MSDMKNRSSNAPKSIDERIAALSAELTRERLAADARNMRMREAVDALRREFEMTVITPLPPWDERLDAEDRHAATMEDEAFAKLRTRVTRERDLLKRVAAQSALVRLVMCAISEKRNRLKALEERIKSGSADEAEVKVAQRRKTFILETMKVLKQRLNAVVGDFARSRKTLLSRVVALTTEVADTVPRGDDYVRSAFSVEAGNIANSLRLLGEMEACFKENQKSVIPGVLGFAGRGK